MAPSEDRRIAPVSEVPEDGTLLFRVREGFDTEEAVLVRLGGAGDGAGDGAGGGDGVDDGDADTGTSDDPVAAWKNYCQHWTDVRLDKGSGAPVRNGEVVCQKHAATFEAETGYCNFGPCEGAYLDGIDVTVHDGAVYLTDDDCEFAGLGPDPDRDRSTGAPGGRIDFTGS